MSERIFRRSKSELLQQLLQFFPQASVIHAFVVNFSAWIVSGPELVSQLIGEIREGGDRQVVLLGLGDEGSEIMDFSERPPAGEQKGFEEAFGCLLQKLDGRLGGPLCRKQSIRRGQPAASRSELIMWITLVGLHATVKPCSRMCL